MQPESRREVIVARFEKILVLDNEVEARLLESMLQDKEIPHLIRSYHDSAYDGLWQQQQGWGHVEAPQRYKQEILEIFQDLNTMRRSNNETVL
jgi:hypothetical protein